MTHPNPTPVSSPVPATRPCRPGDVLTCGTLAHGGDWYVSVDTPIAHADHGTDAPFPVAVRGVLRLPAPAGLLAASHRAGADCLGESLCLKWGTASDGYRQRVVYRTGPAIATLIDSVRRSLLDAAAIADGVAAAHTQSVARLEAERAAAYAAWPVRDDSGGAL